MTNKLLTVNQMVNDSLRVLVQNINDYYANRGFLMNDADRQNMNNATLNFENGIHEHRYEERGAEYNLKTWRDHECNTTGGYIDQRPKWLTNVIDMAKIGGHVHHIKQPPPDLIVWFKTNDAGNLINFIEMK